MAAFNIEAIQYIQTLRVSPPPTGSPSAKEVQVLLTQHLGARTKPQPTSQSGPSAPGYVERRERFNYCMTEVDKFCAAADDHFSPPAMRQTYDSPRYNEEDFFLHARPAHVSASSSTTRQSLQARSPTPDFLTGTHSELNSGRFEAPLFGLSPSPPGMGAASTTAVNLEPDLFTLNNTINTNPSPDTPDLQPSPPHYSQGGISNNYTQRSMRQPSLSSGRSTPREFTSQRRTRQGMQDFIDLTADPTSPTIPAATSALASPRVHASQEANSDSVHASKRRKVQPPASSNPASFTVKEEPHKIEQVDLRDVDDDSSLSKVLEQQRAETVKSQQNDGNQPIKLSSLQCIICMEPMTNITATHCGRFTPLHILLPSC